MHAISLEQKTNAFSMEAAKQSLTLASNSLGRIGNDSISPASSFKEITSFSHKWLIDQKAQFVKKDFGDVFEKYIHN